MLAAFRSRAHFSVALPRGFPLAQTLGFPHPSRFSSSSSSSLANLGFLNLEEVEKILNDVRADDVKVIPVKEQCDWTDFMVIATGRSPWHVKNIAQALIHKVKQKQIGSERMLLPSVEGHAAGNWIVVDSGTVIVHALDEKARAYYNLESLWTKDISTKGKGPNQKNTACMDSEPDYLGLRRISLFQNQDLGEAFAKIRRKNNSKKKPMKSATQS